MHNDFLGRPLEVGDRVVTTQSGYERLSERYVHSFTPTMVRLSGSKTTGPVDRKSPEQIVKVGEY